MSAKVKQGRFGKTKKRTAVNGDGAMEGPSLDEAVLRDRQKREEATMKEMDAIFKKHRTTLIQEIRKVRVGERHWVDEPYARVAAL